MAETGKQTILVIAALPDSLLRFRLSLLADMRSRGYRVIACAARCDALSVMEGGDVSVELAKLGVSYRTIPLNRTGKNPLADLLTLMALWRLCREERPDVVLSYTAKPVIYGSLAARLAGVPAIFSLMTGLPFGLSEEPTPAGRGLNHMLARGLFRLAFACNSGLIFQNPDDQATLRRQTIVRASMPTSVVNGSGVDLAHYRVAPLPPGAPTFILIARLLREKGIAEFADAAGKLNVRHPGIRCVLVGPIEQHPDGFREAEIRAWEKQGALEWLGPRADVREVLSSSTVFVLPSYHEGTPRTVLEAMAMGRPIITTAAPGCRETVRLSGTGLVQKQKGEPVMEGENGFLVETRNTDAVLAAMERFIEDPTMAPRMGRMSRQIVEDKYDVHTVDSMMMEAMGLS